MFIAHVRGLRFDAPCFSLIGRLVPPSDCVTALLEKKLLFVTGKGGVGKTTLSAALGRLAAERGRRVLLVEVDEAASMGVLFDDQRVGFEPTEVAPNLWACALDAERSMEAFIRRFVSSRRIGDLILGNRVAQIFFRAAPSVLEAVVLDQLATLAASSDPGFDTIVVDLPASGHAVKFLRVPRSMARMVAVGELARHLEKLAQLLEDERHCEMVVVALPEEMPVNETIELVGIIRRELLIPVRHVVCNAVRAPELDEADVERVDALAASAGGTMDRLRSALALGRFWRVEDAHHLERLREGVSATLLQTPFIFRPTSDTSLVQRVADALRAQLGSEGAA